MRPELRALPTEIWFDILECVRRRRLAQRVDQLGDRAFCTLAMLWLHIEGRRTLPMLNVDIDQRLLFAEDPILCEEQKQQQQQQQPVENAEQQASNCFIWVDIEPLPLAQVQLPDNIVDFEGIHIRALDHGLIRFLRRLQPLFNDVNLLVSRDHLDARMADSLDWHVFPLLTSVNSIFFHSVDDFLHIFEHALPTLMDARILEIKSTWNLHKILEKLWQWLCAKPRHGGDDWQQRCGKILKIWGHCDFYDEGTTRMMRTLRQLEQKFLAATEPARFCILVWNERFDGLEEVRVRNARTGEWLQTRIFNGSAQYWNWGAREYLSSQYMVMSRQPGGNSGNDGMTTEQQQRELEEMVVAWDFHKQKRRIALKCEENFI